MKPFLTVDDICEMLDRKQAYVYQIIKTLNEELEEQGYMTCSGRVPAWYFYKRFGISYNKPKLSDLEEVIQ